MKSILFVIPLLLILTAAALPGYCYNQPKYNVEGLPSYVTIQQIPAGCGSEKAESYRINKGSISYITKEPYFEFIKIRKEFFKSFPMDHPSRIMYETFEEPFANIILKYKIKLR